MRRFLLLLFFFPSLAFGQVNVGQQGLNTWTTYTPTLSCAAGTLTTSSATGRYLVYGKTVFIQISITITTNGTCATALRATAPTGLAPAADNRYILSGLNLTTGSMIYGNPLPSSGFINIKFYQNTYPGADATSLTLNGTYELP